MATYTAYTGNYLTWEPGGKGILDSESVIEVYFIAASAIAISVAFAFLGWRVWKGGRISAVLILAVMAAEMRRLLGTIPVLTALRIAKDFLQLIRHPGSFIVERAQDQSMSAFWRAMGLFVIVELCTHAALRPSQLPVRFASSLLDLGIAKAAMVLAWRLTGGKATISSQTTATVYLSALVGSCIIALDLALRSAAHTCCRTQSTCS
jgi:hypothetical protein